MVALWCGTLFTTADCGTPVKNHGERMTEFYLPIYLKNRQLNLVERNLIDYLRLKLDDGGDMATT